MFESSMLSSMLRLRRMFLLVGKREGDGDYMSERMCDRNIVNYRRMIKGIEGRAEESVQGEKRVLNIERSIILGGRTVDIRTLRN